MSPFPQLANGLLAALPTAEYARIAPLLTRETVPPRTMLFTTGEPIERVYFPLGGICSLTATMEDGRMAEIGVVGCEGVVGHTIEMGPPDAPHDAMIQIPEAVLDVMSARDFKNEMARGEVFAARVKRYVFAELGMAARGVACNALHSAEQRMARWLLHARDRVGPEFRLSHEFVAIMLGARRPTVTVVAGTLQRAGLIRYSRARMEVLDAAGLEDRACECYRAISNYYEGLLPSLRPGPREQVTPRTETTRCISLTT